MEDLELEVVSGEDGRRGRTRTGSSEVFLESFGLALRSCGVVELWERAGRGNWEGFIRAVDYLVT